MIGNPAERYYRNTLLVLAFRLDALNPERRVLLAWDAIQKMPPMYADWKPVKITLSIDPSEWN